MATVTIPEVAVEVETDLGTAPDIGPSVSTVSAAQSASIDLFHRINPFFFRLSDTTETVRVKFDCVHTPSNSVVYASANGTPKSHTWSGKAKVDTTRTRRTREAAKRRKVKVTAAPSASVTRTIVCTFEVVERFNSRTQTWERLPPAQTASPRCHIEFDLTP